MTKKHSTKRALVASVMALLLCFSMLLGTTFAWFTDTVTSVGNIIKTGKLDVEMYWADGTKAVPTDASDWTDASTGAIFDYDNWEPGYVQARHIKISNEGSLAVQYKVSIIANGSVTDLADVIDVYYTDPAVQVTDRDALTDANKLGTLTQVLADLDTTAGGTLAAGTADTITIVFKMQEDAGNEYQEKSIGCDFIVQLIATQYTAEPDSFDDQYDVKATFLNQDADGAWLINNLDELYFFASQVNSGNSYRGETVKLTADIDLAGYNWIPIGSGDVNGQWIGFNGIFDGQNHTISNLKVTKGGGWNGLFGLVGRGTTGVTESISNVKLENVTIEGANRMSGALVGQIYGNVENCHAKNVTISAIPNAVASGYDNGDKIGGLVGWLGDNGNNHYIKNCTVNGATLKAYRDVGGITGYIGSSSTVEGCSVDTASITIDQATNHYGVKDANAGAIVGRIYKQPVTVQNNTEVNVTLVVPTTVASAAGLIDAIANAQDGETIVLATDVELATNTSITVSTGTNVIIDLNGHMLSAENTNTATHNFMIDVKGGELTMKNGTVSMEHTGANMGWNGATTVIDVTAGGVLNLDSVVVENKGGTDMNFAVHLNNWGTATLNADNCVFKATYCSVRVFNSGPDMNNVKITNSTMTGATRAFWVHNYAASDMGGKVYSGASAAYDQAVVDARLNLDIYNNNNTFEITGNAKSPIRYGFNVAVYYDANGNIVP